MPLKKVLSVVCLMIVLIFGIPCQGGYAEKISEPVTIQIEDEPQIVENVVDVEEVQIPEEQSTIQKIPTYYQGLYSDGDRYLIAKMVMAEAEGSSIATKEYIACVILNRVLSNSFPNTVKDVLFQQTNNVYQFSPIGNGRWERVEPNEECYKATDEVLSLTEDISEGATFFEDCEDPDNWHSRNLHFLYKSDATRFYKVKGG